MSARNRHDQKAARRGERGQRGSGHQPPPQDRPSYDPAPGKRLPICYEVGDQYDMPVPAGMRERLGVTRVVCWQCLDPACPVVPGVPVGEEWHDDLSAAGSASSGIRGHALWLKDGAAPPPLWAGPRGYRKCADPGCPDFGVRPVFPGEEFHLGETIVARPGPAGHP